MHIRLFFGVLALTSCCVPAMGNAGRHASPVEFDHSAAWRAAAAHVLEAQEDPGSLATAAALVVAGAPARSKAESPRAAAAVEDAVRASEMAPDDPAIGWLRLELCAADPACDMREAATTMRWVDADNGAVWLPTLAIAQKDRDTVQVDRVLADMAEGKRFDIYTNRAAVMMYDALKRVGGRLPARYLPSDLARLNEALGLAAATFTPSFSPLINACREAGSAERRESCLALSKTMQKSDAVMAQLVGFAIEKRLTPVDGREGRLLAERRRLLEWRMSAANAAEPLLPWLRNARARARLGRMRALAREEDVYIALLRQRKMPLEPPEDRR
jgi:hypothetical protein